MFWLVGLALTMGNRALNVGSSASSKVKSADLCQREAGITLLRPGWRTRALINGMITSSLSNNHKAASIARIRDRASAVTDLSCRCVMLDWLRACCWPHAVAVVAVAAHRRPRLAAPPPLLPRLRHYRSRAPF